MKLLKLVTLLLFLFLLLPLNATAFMLENTELKEGTYNGNFSYKNKGTTFSLPARLVVSDKAILGFVYEKNDLVTPFFFSKSPKAKFRYGHYKTRFFASEDSKLLFKVISGDGKKTATGSAESVDKGVKDPSRFKGIYLPPKGNKFPAALNISSDGSALFFLNLFLPAGYHGDIDDSGNFTTLTLRETVPETVSEGLGIKLIEIGEKSYELWIIEAEDDIQKIPLEKID